MRLEPSPLSRGMGGSLAGHAERMLPGGETVVRSKTGVFLVPGVVPGDEVRFTECKRRRGSRRGTLLELVRASPLRVAPACPVAATCGGCAMQGMEESVQARIKSDWVIAAFRPCMTKETQWRPVVPGGGGRRRRARWWRAPDGVLGFRARASHRVVPHDTCASVLPRMNAVRHAIQGRLPESVQSVLLTALHDGMHVVLETDAQQTPHFAPPDCGGGVQYWLRTPAGFRPLGKVRALHDCLPAGDTEVLLQVGPDDFVQGEQKGNARIVRLLQQWADGARLVVDLFAGIGNLSLPLARAIGCRVLGAEVRQHSVAMANANARRLGVEARYRVADLTETRGLSEFAGADVLILDPPRRGARQICRSMGTLLPKSIIMLSCDVAAGGRDAAILQAQGYRLRALRAFDLFPCAGHVEAVSLWVQ